MGPPFIRYPPRSCASSQYLTPNDHPNVPTSADTGPAAPLEPARGRGSLRPRPRAGICPPAAKAGVVSFIPVAPDFGAVPGDVGGAGALPAGSPAVLEPCEQPLVGRRSASATSARHHWRAAGCLHVPFTEISCST